MVQGVLFSDNTICLCADKVERDKYFLFFLYTSLYLFFCFHSNFDIISWLSSVQSIFQFTFVLLHLRSVV